jgi:hypothetical protein
MLNTCGQYPWAAPVGIDRWKEYKITFQFLFTIDEAFVQFRIFYFLRFGLFLIFPWWKKLLQCSRQAIEWVCSYCYAFLYDFFSPLFAWIAQPNISSTCMTTVHYENWNKLLCIRWCLFSYFYLHAFFTLWSWAREI